MKWRIFSCTYEVFILNILKGEILVSFPIDTSSRHVVRQTRSCTPPFNIFRTRQSSVGLNTIAITSIWIGRLGRQTFSLRPLLRHVSFTLTWKPIDLFRPERNCTEFGQFGENLGKVCLCAVVVFQCFSLGILFYSFKKVFFWIFPDLEVMRERLMEFFYFFCWDERLEEYGENTDLNKGFFLSLSASTSAISLLQNLVTQMRKFQYGKSFIEVSKSFEYHWTDWGSLFLLINWQ